MTETKKTKQNELLLQRLHKPDGKADVVLDTDAFNEIDDQYALAYLIRSSEKLCLKAVYAAPFYNEKVKSPGEGMEKSYEEIHHVLELMGENELRRNVFRGSTVYLPDETTPVHSPAVLDLIERSQGYSVDNPLYVVAIGAITNIASAILKDPTIVDRIYVVWLGGHAHHWPHNYAFNLRQDIAGARILFGCKVPMTQIPGMGVTSAFTVSGPELECWLAGKNKICDYLVDITQKEAVRCYGRRIWTRPIWDVPPVAWLLDGDFISDCIVHSPIPEYDHRYAFDPARHFIRYAYHVRRDSLLEDLVKKLGANP